MLALLSEPLYRYRALVIDEMALPDTPYPAIFQQNQEGIVQLFFHSDKANTHLYVLDEQGALFHQQMPPTETHHLLLQQQRFLDGIRLLRSLLTEEPAHRLLLDSPEFYQLSRDREGRFVTSLRTPPRHRLPDSYLDLRLVSEGLHLSQAPYLLVCGDREFSSLEHGEALFTRVVEYLITKRSNHRAYPIYLTGIESAGIAGEGLSSTIELYQFKKRLERKLNQALAQLLDA